MSGSKYPDMSFYTATLENNNADKGYVTDRLPNSKGPTTSRISGRTKWITNAKARPETHSTCQEAELEKPRKKLRGILGARKRREIEGVYGT